MATGRVVTGDEVATRETSVPDKQTYLVDCDVHLAPASEDEIRRLLPKRWREYAEKFDRRFQTAFYPRRSPYGERLDAWPPSGLPPGTDRLFVKEQHLDAWNIDIAIITPTRHPGTVRNLEYSAALAHAMNMWQIGAWLEWDPRVRGSILVPTEDPDAAAREIHLFAEDDRFVQVYLYSSSTEPIGRGRYWKIFEAAERAKLPIAMHFGSGGASAPTGAGFPSYYIEEHAGVATAFQDQVASLVFEGVFQRFPDLRLVLVEGGFAWLLPLMWRLDAAWQRLWDEVPHVDRPPSEIIKDHIWYTSQPMEEPPRRGDFSWLLEQLSGSRRLMFASDYPHWDFDALERSLPGKLGPTVRRQILGENARTLYQLPA